MPSFVFSLAGLLAFEGALLFILGDDGTINLPSDSWLIQFAKLQVPPGRGCPTSWSPLMLRAYLGSQLLGRQRRSRRPPSPAWLPMALAKAAAHGRRPRLPDLLPRHRPRLAQLWLLFVALVVVMDLVLRKTTWGRHVFAVGGNEEAARRSGIKVGRIYTQRVRRLLHARGTRGPDGGRAPAAASPRPAAPAAPNLTAIAAAVIGGTSLFGGRGSAYSAMLGILVLQAIESGLNLVGVDSVGAVHDHGRRAAARGADRLGVAQGKRTSSGRG